MVVEDEDVRTWDVGLVCCFQCVGEEFWFDDEGFHFGGLERMGEFVRGVRGVDASEDAAKGESA